MGIELRFYRERYEMDDAYYAGTEDIYCRLYFRGIGELKELWETLMSAQDHWFEGETYSAWREDGKFLCGGAFDPGDIDYIESEYKEESK